MLIQYESDTHSGLTEWITIESAELTDCGAPVVLTAEQLALLEAGKMTRYGQSGTWCRLPRAPKATRPAVVTTPAFTCPQCGGHRDTTLRGLCDDCNG
jgi:hypothetical protein